jgi:hypothetical protein
MLRWKSGCCIGKVDANLEKWMLIWKSGCCEDRDHVTNLRDQSYQQNMMADLQEAKKNFKDFLFQDGKHHFKVVDPAVDFKGMAEAEI